MNLIPRFLLTALLGCAAAFASSASAADLHVGTGQTYSTIQAAIDAATTGTDTIVVHTGNYNEALLWSKAVNITEAFGNTAVLRPQTTTGDPNQFLVDWQGSGEAIWDGVDIVVDSNRYIRVLLFRGDSSTSITVSNMTITDTANINGGDRLRVIAPESGNITLNNVVSNTNNRIHESIVLYGPGSQGTLTANDCTFSGNSDKVIGAESATVVMNLNRCTLTKNSVGGTVDGYMTDWSNGTLNMNDCLVIPVPGASRGLLARGGNTAETSVMNVNRTVIDARQDSWPICFENSTILNFINSVVIKDPSVGGVQFAAIAYAGSSTMNFKHATFSYTAEAGGNTVVNIEAGGTTTVDMQNCIIDIRGSNFGAVRLNTGSGTQNITGTTNLINKGSGTEALGLLTGTVVEADPGLDTDLIHLASASSPAVDVAPSIGITSDFDGDSRPLGAGPDFGADEFLSGPPVLGASHWNMY